MIKAVFFTRFHLEKGPHVLHQCPANAISAPTGTTPPPLFDFQAIANILIPPKEFCDRLVAVCINHYRVIGFPVCITNPKYERNEYIFNFSLVLEEDADFTGYTNVVKKLANTFRNLEEQSGFLSVEEGIEFLKPTKAEEEDEEDEEGELETATTTTESSSISQGKDAESTRSEHAEEKEGDPEKVEDEDDSSEDEESQLLSNSLADSRPSIIDGAGSKVYALCEIIMEDLNNYCECMLPIDESNTLNLKLFPSRPAPAPVYAHHVPLLLVQLEAFLQSQSSDADRGGSSKSNSKAPANSKSGATDPDTSKSTDDKKPRLPGINMATDLTLGRILPYIDGVNSVDVISQLAKTDLTLTRKAIRHLLYYGCVILLDIFSFSAIYAPTAEMGRFVENENDVQQEALAYVRMPPPKLAPPKPTDYSNEIRLSTPTARESEVFATTHEQVNRTLARLRRQIEAEEAKAAAQHGPAPPPNGNSKPPSPHKQDMSDYEALAHEPTTQDLVQLYTSLRQGITLRQFIQENRNLCRNIDMRRFMTFGVIKGFLYRVHKYAIAPSIGTPAAPSTSTTYPNTPAVIGWPKNTVRSGFFDDVESELAGGVQKMELKDLPLTQYLDGTHSFDEICTELRMSEKEVLAKMRQAFGDVMVIHK